MLTKAKDNLYAWQPKTGLPTKNASTRRVNYVAFQASSVLRPLTW